MKKLTICFAALLGLSLMLTSCSEIQQFASQLQGVANLANCKFSLKSVSSVSLCGINLKSASSGKITVADGVNLANCLVRKTVPLSMNVNINVQNPTSQKANVTKMDWILYIEGTRVASGTSYTKQVIPANTTSSVALGVSSDLYDVFSKQGIDGLKKFANSFGSNGQSSNVRLQIRPYLTIGGAEVPCSYIDVIK